ncbi:hypothetical protein BDW02DRAFT_168256 [Decorospora gaudefroyi]|uniref:Uncharacterized protein n=1 Tax=Decorospora gaudefroyi TaxID=184978 RepID=A0A6A5JX70_9PLEO|nr:hypothetical protein BDW02DRAFT_168256 [Decorospora gaudefroyi]
MLTWCIEVGCIVKWVSSCAMFFASVLLAYRGPSSTSDEASPFTPPLSTPRPETFPREKTCNKDNVEMQQRSLPYYAGKSERL